MSKYSKSYISSHCIDLFFHYRGRDIHVMTDGNAFPEELNDLERNRGIQREIACRLDFVNIPENARIDPAFEKVFREQLHQFDQKKICIQECLELFLSMAALGFYSYDCVGVGEDGRGKYVLVASPNQEGVNLNNKIPEFGGIEPITEGMEMVGFWM